MTLFPRPSSLSMAWTVLPAPHLYLIYVPYILPFLSEYSCVSRQHWLALKYSSRDNVAQISTSFQCFFLPRNRAVRPGIMEHDMKMCFPLIRLFQPLSSKHLYIDFYTKLTVFFGKHLDFRGIDEMFMHVDINRGFGCYLLTEKCGFHRKQGSQPVACTQFPDQCRYIIYIEPADPVDRSFTWVKKECLTLLKQARGLFLCTIGRWLLSTTVDSRNNSHYGRFKKPLFFCVISLRLLFSTQVTDVLRLQRYSDNNTATRALLQKTAEETGSYWFSFTLIF